MWSGGTLGSAKLDTRNKVGSQARVIHGREREELWSNRSRSGSRMQQNVVRHKSKSESRNHRAWSGVSQASNGIR